jgi:uncharacterized protein YdhG (YjbR/CyaY superfamily)
MDERVRSVGERTAWRLAMAKYATVDDYIASFPEDVQATLQAVRRTVREAAPGTQETISYGIPTLTLDGRYVVYYAGWKRHVSVYPIPESDAELAKSLAPYVAAKGTLRFPLDAPIPHQLIAKVTARLLEQRRRAG